MSKTEWWRGAVIYQIYPRSFLDTNGDGVGDLRGITQKLDVVAKLGVDAIWISPFFESPMKDFGYDISNYRKIDPSFGTMDDFKTLLQTAHDLGLKILLDQVWSHTSDQHDWFKQSRKDKTNPHHDWYVWAEPKPDGTPPNNWLSIFGGPAWTWDTRREQYYLHHFLSCQPALNLWNPDVRAEILDTAKFWLNMGVDGFRLDVINCAFSDKDLKDNPVRPKDMPPPKDLLPSNPMARQCRSHAYSYMGPASYDWLRDLRTMADGYGDIFLMGEIGGEDSEVSACHYTKTKDRLHSAYSFSLTSKRLTKETVLEAASLIEQNIEDGWMTLALGNHDNARFPSVRQNPEDGFLKDYALYGMALVLSMRGSVCLYQGDELGLPTAVVAFEDMQDPYDIRMYPDSMNRDSARTPYPWVKSMPQAGFTTAAKPWLPVYPAQIPLAFDGQDEDPHSTLNHYRRFLRFRASSPALRHGRFKVVDSPDSIIAFERSEGDEHILCLFNTSDKGAAMPLPKQSLDMIDEISRGVKLENNQAVFAPYGYALLRG